MADVQVKRATIAGTRIERLVVSLHGLPDRTIDRDVAIAWMRDGHSLIPMIDGVRQPALGLVEVDGGHVIRADGAVEGGDQLPPLPEA
ncbi:MAG: hypothetical protein ABMA64_20150 [Myxococcota bacterium]